MTLHYIDRCIEDIPDGEPRSRALRKLQLLRFRLETMGRPRNMMHVGSRYAKKLLDRFDESRSTDGCDQAK